MRLREHEDFEDFRQDLLIQLNELQVLKINERMGKLMEQVDKLTQDVATLTDTVGTLQQQAGNDSAELAQAKADLETAQAALATAQADAVDPAVISAADDAVVAATAVLQSLIRTDAPAPADAPAVVNPDVAPE